MDIIIVRAWLLWEVDAMGTHRFDMDAVSNGCGVNMDAVIVSVRMLWKRGCDGNMYVIMCDVSGIPTL